MSSIGGHDGSERTGDSARAADLRSLAVLDALGMLDEVDAGEFDRAFREASPALQSELRELQASAATDPAFLAAADDPPADLKARTLARVMTDVERQDTRFAPIAHIGRTSARVARSGPVDQREFIEQAVELANVRKDFERFSRSSYYWRAAAIALSAALTVALVFQASTKSFAATVTAYALGAASPQALLEELGNPGAARRIESAALRRGMSGSEGGAVVAFSADGTCTVVLMGLKPAQDYTVRLVEESGAVTELHSFRALRSSWAAEFPLGEITLARAGGGRIEVVDRSGNVVMKS